jgi:nickel superoxide dismutase
VKPNARKEEAMRLSHVLRPRRVVHAHCDLPCGVYDPAQARIEAESVKAIQQKYQDAANQKKPTETVDQFQQRSLKIKEERADLVKHHLWVLWTDYFKPEHLERYPDLHDKFWKATKLAGDSKRSVEPDQGQQLLDSIGEIDKIFWDTKR